MPSTSPRFGFSGCGVSWSTGVSWYFCEATAALAGATPLLTELKTRNLSARERA